MKSTNRSTRSSSRSHSFDESNSFDKSSGSSTDNPLGSASAGGAAFGSPSSKERELSDKDAASPVECLSSDLCGLRYLDLSYCRLSDSTCSEILQASISIHSPIEGLELEVIPF